LKKDQIILLEYFKRAMEIDEDPLSILTKEKKPLPQQNLQKLPDITFNKIAWSKKSLFPKLTPTTTCIFKPTQRRVCELRINFSTKKILNCTNCVKSSLKFSVLAKKFNPSMV
jgi:hypothetical protein